jgi:tRNA dimethylallyltransferase
MELKKTLFIVVGPTASGKSELAVSIAKKWNGAIISADSRQIYKGLDIGSGKVPGHWQKGKFIYKGIPHYLIDEASPRVQYSAARFQKQARQIIAQILKDGKTPVICGGTGHWIDATVFDQSLPSVKPNRKLRAKLNRLTPARMFEQLQKLDPQRAAEIDSKNPRRLLRALEIVMSTGKPVPKIVRSPKPYRKDLEIRWIGLNPDKNLLDKKILKRLRGWFKSGLLEEIKKLRDATNGYGLSWKKIESFGLEYKFCALYLQGKISKLEAEALSYTAIRQYAKRQLTWWKRNADIKWYEDSKKVKI